MKKRTYSIRFKITTYAILCFFLFLGLVIAIASTLYATSISTLIDEQIINTSRQVVSNYEYYFNNAIEVTNAIQIKVQNIDVLEEKSAVQEYFDDIQDMKGEIISIALYDEKGDLIVSDSGYVSSEENVYENDSYQNAISEPMINIFSAVGYEDDRYAFTLSRYLNYKNEENYCVALIEFDFSKIVRQIYQSDLGENGHIVIFDRNYEVVYSSKPEFVEEDYKATKELVLGSKSVNINNQSFNLYISTIADTSWKVSVFTNNSQVYNSLNLFIALTVATTICLGVIYLIAIYFVIKQVTNPLYKLQNEMNKIKDLNYEVKHSSLAGGSKEIIQLEETFNDLMKRIRDLAGKLVEERDNQRKSELKALQNQINPHFLYNTLDSIIYMIDKGESQKAEQMIVALSKFFRISISRGKNIIPLKDEIEHVRNYLLIQKIRFGDQFNYTINVSSGLEGYYCMKLILQPIVENAIEHGLNDALSGGRIDIKAYIDGEFIVLEVTDNGYGISSEKLKEIEKSFQDKNIHRGVGLQNVYQRIKIYYGEKGDIKIHSIEDEGTTISILIPKERAKNDDEKK